MKYTFKGNQHRHPFIVKAKRIVKSVVKTAAVMCLIMWGAVAGGAYEASHAHPSVVEAQSVVTQVVQATTTAPVMARIAQCESGGSQYDRNGQVILHVNADKSVDEGIYQINLATWGSTAHAMGYDLSKQEDNAAFATWLYENKGTGSWSSSSGCWSK